MSEVSEGSGKCADPGCLEYRFDVSAALREGWDEVEGGLFCPLHRAAAARRALKTAELAQFKARADAFRVQRHELEAKTCLTTPDYARWNEFQQELTRFHKRHGKLAPAALRLLDPRKWLAHTAKNGEINVEKEAEGLYAAEERAEATRSWLIGRVE
jgi:hypothetical protein